MEDCPQLRDLILNTTEPLVLRNVEPRWKCFSCSLSEWCQRYDAATKKPANFERISRKCTKSPQWERKRQQISLTVERFLADHSEEQDYWTGLNYIRSSEMPAICVEDVDFKRFGFPDVAQDATYWLSSKGANTPAHYDTYGCNIVWQQYGSKSWLLLSPGSPLTSTRLPYEESSVYCSENFYAPRPDEVDSLAHKLQGFAYNCVLHAGDVLIVPHHWWHFVEALELSLSVNAWLPLHLDTESQLDECIVKYIMEACTRDAGSTTDMLQYIFNPNQLSEFADESVILQVITHLHKKLTQRRCEESTDATEDCQQRSYAYKYLPESEFGALLKSVPQAEKVSQMSRAQLSQFLQQNSERYIEQNEPAEGQMDGVKEALMNSLCEPHVVASVRKQLCKRLNLA